MRVLIAVFLLSLTLAPRAFSQQENFPEFDHWRGAVLAGDSNALSALYVQPGAQITKVNGSPIPFSEEVSFWSSWKSKGLASVSAEITPQRAPQPALRVFWVQLTLTFKPGLTPRKEFVALLQGWTQRGEQWLLALEQRTDATRLRQPIDRKQIYAPMADANMEIAEALHKAGTAHKRVLVVFGGNWCFDCHVLDEAFHAPEIAPTLNKSFVVVHVDIGQMDKNLDVAKEYDVPLDRGVPAIAVLDSDGKLLFSQKHGEFEAARSMAPEDILTFLNKWQPRI